jgi:hypothetical protein
MMPGGGLEPPTRGFSALISGIGAKMTAFDKATDLPASINTLEKLAAWSLLALYTLHGKEEYNEITGQMTPIITLQQGQAANETERLIFRASLRINDNWIASTNKLWLEAMEFANASIPASFKS